MKKALNILTVALFILLVTSSIISITKLLEITPLHNDIVGGYEVLYEVDGDVSLAKEEITIKLEDMEILDYVILEEKENIRVCIREVTTYSGENINSGIKEIENELFTVNELSINDYEDVNPKNGNLLLITLLVSFTLITLFMVFYYREYGLIAALTLIVYASLVLLIFNIFGQSITIPALGALLFGLGIAIDSAIILFERIKEKLHENRSIKYAVENANKYSMKSIIDGNLTTVLIGVVLLVFGGFYVQSFGFALIVSLLSSYLIMVIVLRVVLESISNLSLLKNRPDLTIGYVKTKKKTFHFMKHKKKFFRISGILILLGMIIMVLFKFNTSIDLNGGTEIFIDSEINTEELSSKLIYLGFETATIEKDKIIFDYKLEVEDRDQITEMLQNEYQLTPKVNLTDGIMKDQNTRLFVYTMLISFVSIFLYLWLRFDIKVSIATLVAVIHDVLIITGVFALLGLELNLLFLISLLIIIGYSVNDSIILFDRIRENININKKEKEKIYPYSIVNRSITETLGRTFSTSITTLLPLLILMIFIPGDLRVFSLSIVLGVIIGTYSSLTIASGLWLDLNEKN